MGARAWRAARLGLRAACYIAGAADGDAGAEAMGAAMDDSFLLLS